MVEQIPGFGLLKSDHRRRHVPVDSDISSEGSIEEGIGHIPPRERLLW